VLIVDDELGVRESLRMALKGAYEVTAVGSAPEAVQALARRALPTSSCSTS